MCEHHKKMITDSSNDTLMSMLDQQSELIGQLTILLDGMGDSSVLLKHLFTETQSKPWEQVHQELDQVRVNAQAIFDFIHEELNTRLDAKLSNKIYTRVKKYE